MKTSPPNPQNVIVREDADLRVFWQGIVGPDGFGQRSLWLALFDSAGRPLPMLIPIDGVPARPDGLVDNLAEILRRVAAEHHVDSVAALLARPGSAAITNNDRRWAGILNEENTNMTMVWPTHLATHGRVVALAPL